MTSRPPPAPVTVRGHLPPGFAEVADLLGDAALLALLEAYGGTRLYVPEQAAPGGKLVTLLGDGPARRLVARYGRDTIRVPLCKPWMAAMLHARGLTHAAIARQLKMNEHNVQRLLSGTRRGAGACAEQAAPPQLSLQLGD